MSRLGYAHIVRLTCLIVFGGFQPVISFAQTPPIVDGTSIVRSAEAISKDIASGDLHQAAIKINEAMKSTAVPIDSLKTNLQPATALGKFQYMDTVYSRDIGKTTKDIVHKLNFEKNILFVRYLASINEGEWRLIRFTFATETTLPFPREWPHIYP